MIVDTASQVLKGHFVIDQCLFVWITENCTLIQEVTTLKPGLENVCSYLKDKQ